MGTMKYNDASDHSRSSIGVPVCSPSRNSLESEVRIRSPLESNVQVVKPTLPTPSPHRMPFEQPEKKRGCMSRYSACDVSELSISEAMCPTGGLFGGFSAPRESHEFRVDR